MSISCLPPKPPPTRLVNTCTSSRSSPKTWHSSSRTRNGTCELVRITKRPSASRHPVQPCVSRCACWTRCGAPPAPHHRVRLVGGRRDIADPAVQLGDDVARRVRDPGIGCLVAVDQGRSGCPRGLGIEHRGQLFVFDCDCPAGLFGDREAVGDDRGHPLPDEAHGVVQHVGVVGVVGRAVRGARSRTAPAGCRGGSAPTAPRRWPRRRWCRPRRCAHAAAGCPAPPGATGPAARSPSCTARCR